MSAKPLRKPPIFKERPNDRALVNSIINNPLKPSATLLIKLGSAMIHAEELIETKYDISSRIFDEAAFNTVAQDPEVVEWVKQMGPMLPRKRSTR